MDIASAFATIIGLLCNFKNESRTNEEQTTKEFETWLQKKNHSEVLDYILENNKILVGLEKLLKKDRKSMNQIMSSLNDNMIMFSSKIDGLSDIANAINPNLSLSEQCISILKQVYDAGDNCFMEHINIRLGNSYQLKNGGKIIYDEPRFIGDDLRILTDSELLNLEITSKGTKKFNFTRKAKLLIETIYGK
tara:strand:- start:1748 stop:2323 length:576 start_codon:yes stop_codon:yes gene_type:complete